MSELLAPQDSFIVDSCLAILKSAHPVTFYNLEKFAEPTKDASEEQEKEHDQTNREFGNHSGEGYERQEDKNIWSKDRSQNREEPLHESEKQLRVLEAPEAVPESKPEDYDTCNVGVEEVHDILTDISAILKIG